MKLSLKVQEQNQQNKSKNKLHNPLLLRAKVSITVFGFPFLSGVAIADPSDLSLSLRSNFTSGPSLKLCYTPTSSSTTTTVASRTTTPPFALTLKSGVSLFGSPQNSPLIISAHFTISPGNLNPNPTFSLQIKPQFGDFSLRKTTYSSPNPNPKANEEMNSKEFVPFENPISWKDLTVESSYKDSFLSGIDVTAKTALPVTKRVAMNFRWGVNFPADISKQLPFLTVNKIGIERVDEVKEVKQVELKRSERNVGDLELLKDLSLSMRRELEVLQMENTEMKRSLEAMKFGKLRGQEWTYQDHSHGVAKKTPPMAENAGDFEKTKNSFGQDNGRKESKKKSNVAIDVESELQRAIKAASS